MDDVFAVIKRNDEKRILEILNAQFPSIKFTYELEKENKLPFLDVVITRAVDRLEFGVYRKPTNVPRYIPADSHCPISHKKAAFNSMVYRLCKLPLNAQNFMDEIGYIKYTARLNGYDEHMIDKLVDKQSKIIRRMNLTTLSSQSDTKKRIKFHYAPRITNKFKSVFKPYNIDLAFTTEALRGKLGSLKDRTENEAKSGIYEIDCDHCNQKYIGQTMRQIITRFKEHTNLKRDVPSAVGAHIMEQGHRITKSNLKLVKSVSNTYELDAYESLYMYKNAEVLMNTMDAPIRSHLFHLAR